MIWFTSDLHLGHTNIVGSSISNWKHGYRTFNSLHEMNSHLLDMINKYVGEDDELWHLGDFCMDKNPDKYLDKIVCKNIHALKGNHDKMEILKKSRFTSVGHVAELYVDSKTLLFLSHYAHRVWNKSHRGSIHLYGHSHGRLPGEWGKSMDVGVDSIYNLFGEYRPISLDEIFKIMEKRSLTDEDSRLMENPRR